MHITRCALRWARGAVLSALLLSACVACLGGNRANGSEPPAAPQRELAAFDVANDGDLLLLPLTVAGATYQFEVDTGAYRVGYDQLLRPLLGLSRESEISITADGSISRDLFEAPGAMLGSLPLRLPASDVTPYVACIDQSQQRESSGHELRGVLGMAFLRKHVIEVDFNRGKLTFLREPRPDAGVRVPILFDEGKWMVRAQLPGLGRSEFMIDTGLVGWSGALNAATARALLAEGVATHVRTGSTTDAVGEHETRYLRLAAIEIGGFDQHHLVFSEHHGEIPNLLGLNFWMRFIVTFDFPNRALYLKPSRWFNHRDALYFARAHDAGFGATRRNGNVLISAVVQGSAADKADLKPGDVVLALDGTSVAGDRLYAVLKRIYEAQEKIQLTVARQGQKIALELKLSPSGR